MPNSLRDILPSVKARMKADDLSDTLDDCSVEIFLDEKNACLKRLERFCLTPCWNTKVKSFWSFAIGSLWSAGWEPINFVCFLGTSKPSWHQKKPRCNEFFRPWKHCSYPSAICHLGSMSPMAFLLDPILRIQAHLNQWPYYRRDGWLPLHGLHHFRNLWEGSKTLTDSLTLTGVVQPCGGSSQGESNRNLCAWWCDVCWFQWQLATLWWKGGDKESCLREVCSCSVEVQSCSRTLCRSGVKGSLMTCVCNSDPAYWSARVRYRL